MNTVKIELVKLRGAKTKRFAATRKQMNFIKDLMVQRGLYCQFKKYFMIGNELVLNNITKKTATKLIDALKRNDLIEFVEFARVPPKLSEPSIKKLYFPAIQTKDVHAITLSEQKSLEEKYMFVLANETEVDKSFKDYNPNITENLIDMTVGHQNEKHPTISEYFEWDGTSFQNREF